MFDKETKERPFTTFSLKLGQIDGVSCLFFETFSFHETVFMDACALVIPPSDSAVLLSSLFRHASCDVPLSLLSLPFLKAPRFRWFFPELIGLTALFQVVTCQMISH